MNDETPSAPPPEQAGRAPRWLWPLVTVIAILVVALAVVAILLFGGANRSAEPDSEPGSSQTPPPSTPPATEQPSPEPSEPAPAVVIPDCATLNPPAQAFNDEFVGGVDSEIEHGEIGLDRFGDVFGPAAQAAMDRAENARGCLYVFSFHDGLRQYVGELDEAGRAPLIAALEADADFAESSYRGARVFTWERPTPADAPMRGTDYTVHIFIGDVWMSTYSMMPPEEYGYPSIDAILDANPWLAE